MATLYQMKEDMATLGGEIKSLALWIGENVSNPAVQMETINEKKAKRDELKTRFDLLKEEHDILEASQKAAVHPGEHRHEKNMPEMRGKFYQAVLLNQPIPIETKSALGAIPEDSTNGGANLLPTNMSNEIISEPFEENPMRDIIGLSNVTNLELPKLAYTVDDDSFISDTETAKELELTGDKVSFGRFKTKIEAKVSDTVLRGSPIALTSYIENALRSGLAAKEKKVMFSTNPVSEEAHMSYYSNVNGIKKVYGLTMLKAILTAYGDLPDLFAANASVIMKRSDYIAMISDIANGADSLWGRKPEDVIGIPVKFCDKATKPIVGDFSYSHLNYDLDAVYDYDKDVSKGIYIFVLTAWFDHKLKLKSAFRIAEVGNDPNPEGEEPNIVEVKTVAALPTTNIEDGTVYVLTGADGEKSSGTMWMHVNDEWVEYGV